MPKPAALFKPPLHPITLSPELIEAQGPPLFASRILGPSADIAVFINRVSRPLLPVAVEGATDAER